ncbi:ATP-grasp peptide maturase system methyltransferase [Kribbella sp. CA-253562]|uniref:ATP-grasp peptide maturase system methyltransferase n=1 Tax=Kribbella sp. CA-253562 TaxID=3239942 RepID=UPI003D8E2D55
MEDTDSSLKLRGQLAERLARTGDLRTAEWRTALERVPREVFLKQYFRQVAASGGSIWEPVLDDGAAPEGRLTEIYADDSLVTQLDGSIRPEDTAVAVPGTPTSSATMPSLVVRMWENLPVDDGSAVAEVGTGTGYSTALACERLGADRVTSIDVDPVVVSNARSALSQVGYFPRLEVADGLDGLPEGPGRGYDRVIAACSLRHVPRPWISSTKPGGKVLLTLSGWLSAFALARLDVMGNGRAEGWFLDDPASFMPARRHAPPGVAEIRTGRPDEVVSDVSISSAILDERVGRLLTQLSVPNVQQASGMDDQGLPLIYLVDSVNDAYAVVSVAEGTVVQGGSARLWDAVEGAVKAWRDAGSPGVEALKITVTPDRQTVGFVDAPDLWLLPEH